MQTSSSLSYSALNSQYKSVGITYKANQTLHKLSQNQQYHYLLLLHTAKVYHFNQFQVIFFSHVLSEEQPAYKADPQIFDHDISHPIMNQILESQEIMRDDNKDEILTLKEIKYMYLYLMVVGYSVKYYLNETIKAYEQQLRKLHPQFFSNVFNVWATKYGNKVLKTNPRKINTFYINIFQNQDVPQNTQNDCQYRNYNEIVEQLIKATTEIEVPDKEDENSNNL